MAHWISTYTIKLPVSYRIYGMSVSVLHGNRLLALIQDMMLDNMVCYVYIVVLEAQSIVWRIFSPAIIGMVMSNTCICMS